MPIEPQVGCQMNGVVRIITEPGWLGDGFTVLPAEFR